MTTNISPDVVILTVRELQEREDAAFQRGVARGKFEANIKPDVRVAKNCANWSEGRCESCGVQWQYFEVDAGFKCPHFRAKAAP